MAGRVWRQYNRRAYALVSRIMVRVKKMRMRKDMKRKEPEEASEQSPGTSTGVPEPDHGASGDAGTGQEDNHENDDGGDSTGPRLVERKTGLRGQSIGQGRIAQSTIRNRTERDLRLPDAEIPYFKTEKAVRDLVCSLLERQDRMNEAIFVRIIDLEYRIDDSEQRRNTVVPKRSGADKGSKK